MRNFWTVTKNELLRYFISPLAYVYLIAFLLLNGSFAIYFGNFFSRGQADLLSMFAYHPWLYLLFIPGISMRLWSEEFRNRTIVQIVTMPVTINTLVWGKFFASWIFCALALVLTFPFWITVNILGSPDNGIIAISYLGSFILAGCMLSISQTMSALTKNQVIALVISVIANLLFFLSGIEYVLAFFRLFAPQTIIDMIASFSFLSHFEIITQGLLELRDIVFFASIILLFNLTTIIIISFKTSGTSALFKSNSRNYYIFAFILLLLGFVGLNLIANNTLRSIQLDVTQDQKFTLTDSTRDILKNLPGQITAKVYYSKELEKRNPNMRLMFDKLRLVLREFEKISKGKFSYRIYNPAPLDKDEDIAYAEGLQPIPLIAEGQNVFFGMIISDEIDNKQIIPFFPVERQGYLEHDIIEKIYLLSHKKKTLGILTTIPVYETQMSENYFSQQWEVINQIENYYNIKDITEPKDLQDIDVLMLIHPRGLSKEMIDAIKEYSNVGGSSLVLLDTAAEAPRIYSPINLEFVPSLIVELEDFWGFRFYRDAVVGDLDNSIIVDATNDYKNPVFVQDIIQFVVNGNNFNKNAIETKYLKNILFASASVLQQKSDKITFIPLIQASKNSQLMYADAVYKQIHPSYILENFKADEYEKIIAAKIINKDPTRRFEVIVVADTDFAYDTFWSKSQSVLDNKYVVPVFDNAAFILNSLDSLSGNIGLVELRGKSQTPRPFTKVENIRKFSQQDFKIKETITFNKIDEAKEKIQEITNKRVFEGRENFTSEELASMASIRQELVSLRKDLASIKKEQDSDIRKIDFYVKLINIYLIPLTILLSLIIYGAIKRRRHSQESTKFELNKPIKTTLLISLMLLTIGALSVYMTQSYEIDEQKDKTVFSGLSSRINDVEKIKIQNNSGSLTFIKKNDIWALEEHPNSLVYQERIKNLMAALLDATFFEKKSSKAENLAKFGLQPIEVAGSPNTRISLLDDKGNKITGFEVGKYGLDIGRGGRAAYIKFDNLFTVWMIEVDFINLSTKWQDWTHSSIWNLSFGRLQNVNKITKPDSLANIAKEILNIEFVDIVENIASPRELLKLEMITEGNNYLELKFLASGDKVFLRYEFTNTQNIPSLQFFASYAKNYYFEIKNEDFERLINVVKTEQTRI